MEGAVVSSYRDGVYSGERTWVILTCLPLSEPLPYSSPRNSSTPPIAGQAHFPIMRVFSSGAAPVLLLSANVAAAPSIHERQAEHPQLTFASPHHHHDEGMQAAVLGPALWVGSKIADAAASLFGAAATTVSDKKVGAKWSEILGGESSMEDMTIWDIINHNEHLTREHEACPPFE